MSQVEGSLAKDDPQVEQFLAGLAKALSGNEPEFEHLEEPGQIRDKEVAGSQWGRLYYYVKQLSGYGLLA